MKTQRDWCGLIGWLLAASLMALQVQFAHAAEAPAGPSISLNRGESYVIKDVSADSAPEVKSIDNPHALIVNKQADGSILVLGAEAGSETVKVKTTDGKVETYTVTVRSNADPNNPLAPGSAPAAASDSSSSARAAKPSTAPLDAGTGPGASAAASPNASGTKTRIVDASEDSTGTAPASGTPDRSSNPAGSPETRVAPSNESAPAAPASGSESPMGMAPSAGAMLPSQAAYQSPSGKFRTDPPVAATEQEPQDMPTGGKRFLPADAISMMFGTSRVFDFPQRIKRVSIADSDIADLQVINPHQLMLIGHKPGFTTLAIWDDQGRYLERQIRIEQTGHQQVLLSCTVAEVNRQKIETQGINYAGTLANSGVSIVGLPGQVATPYTASSSLITSASAASSSGGILPPGGSLIPLLLSTNLTYGLATQNGGLLTNSFFQFLENHDLGRILAEPRLLANSGQEAKFLSGGEIPIVLAQALNTSVVFKQFGTSVVFIPTVIGKNDVELVVKPEVSKPDFSQGVQLFGFTVPAFVTRRAETVVRMKNDQTLIIAGLISTDKEEVIQKVPYLGDIPFVRGLFRSTSYQNTKTELVMSVTPQIVGAMAPGSDVDYFQRGGLTSGEIRTTRLGEPDAARPRF